MILSMTSQTTKPTFFHKLGGYYVIPHELLHVLAYRLIGKPCRYQWGEYRVYSSAKKSRRERLFVLLFPLAVCFSLSLLFHSMWLILALSSRMSPEVYIFNAPKWHFIFHILANLCLLYCGTAYRDVRRALQILSGQEKTNQDNPPTQQEAIQKQRGRDKP